MTTARDATARPLLLLVDDDAEFRHVCGRILRHAGFGVVEARSGVEALDLCTRHRPDVVLLDLVMPEMDGADTAEALRRAPETRSVPVLLLTMMERASLESLRLGSLVQGYVSKQDATASLVDAVERLLRDRRPEPKA